MVLCWGPSGQDCRFAVHCAVIELARQRSVAACEQRQMPESWQSVIVFVAVGCYVKCYSFRSMLFYATQSCSMLVYGILRHVMLICAKVFHAFYPIQSHAMLIYSFFPFYPVPSPLYLSWTILSIPFDSPVCSICSTLCY